MIFPIDVGIPVIQNIQVQQSTYNLENSQNYSGQNSNLDLENTPGYVSAYKNSSSSIATKFVGNIDAGVKTSSANIVVGDSVYTLEGAAPKNGFLSGTTVPVDKNDEPIFTGKILSGDGFLPSINNPKIDVKSLRQKADNIFGKGFLDSYSDEYLAMLWSSEADKIFDPKMDKFFVSEFLKSYFNIKIWYRTQKPGYDAVVVQGARSYQYQLELLSQGRTPDQIIANIDYDLKYSINRKKSQQDFGVSDTYGILRNIFQLTGDDNYIYNFLKNFVAKNNISNQKITWTLFSNHVAKNGNGQAFDVVFVDKNGKLVDDNKNYKTMQDKFVWPTKYLTNANLCKSLGDCAHIQRYYPN